MRKSSRIFYWLLRVFLRKDPNEEINPFLFCAFCLFFPVLTMISVYLYIIRKAEFSGGIFSEGSMLVISLSLALIMQLFVFKAEHSRRMLYRLTGWAIFEEQAQHGNILVETFQEAHKKQTLYAVIILLFASIGGVWFNDYSIVVLSLTAIIALFVHVLMTGYRVHRGFFGTNKTEADELICYVLKNSRNNRLPPGMRVARDLSRQTQSADPVGEAAGVPHKWM